MKRRTYDHEILLLQGGGALGAYHAGVYEGLAEAGVTPTWLVGISIGAVNSAIIAGNPPEQRLERLRIFWDRVSANIPMNPLPWLEKVLPHLGRMSIAHVATFGIPGFFKPRIPPPIFPGKGTPDTLSFYETAPLRSTLEELVDFDLINRGAVRLSLGAVNVRTSESVYFDNRKTRIGPDHVLASGALPPGFPGVKIDGEYYWDGGIVSNSPLTYIFDEKPMTTALIIVVNLFNALGAMPTNMDEVMERVKDIQFSSKQRLNTQRVKEHLEMKAALGRVLAKLPPELKADPDVLKIAPLYDNREWTIAHLNNLRPSRVGQAKDVEFTPIAVKERWEGGLEDVRRSVASLDWVQPIHDMAGVRVFFLPPMTSPGKPVDDPAQRETSNGKQQKPIVTSRGGVTAAAGKGQVVTA